MRVSGGDDLVATVRGNNITHDVGPGLECHQSVYPPFSSFIVECNNVAFNGPGGQIIAEVEISIYGVLGRKVRTLAARTLPAGENELEWGGRGEDGELVASGAYVAVIPAGGREVTRTLRVVR